jgi:hypothetical protein
VWVYIIHGESENRIGEVEVIGSFVVMMIDDVEVAPVVHSFIYHVCVRVLVFI